MHGLEEQLLPQRYKSFVEAGKRKDIKKAQESANEKIRKWRAKDIDLSLMLRWTRRSPSSVYRSDARSLSTCCQVRDQRLFAGIMASSAAVPASVSSTYLPDGLAEVHIMRPPPTDPLGVMLPLVTIRWDSSRRLPSGRPVDLGEESRQRQSPFWFCTRRSIMAQEQA